MAKYQGKYSRNKNEYAELEKSYSGLAPAQRRRKKRETAKRRKIIMGVCIGVLVLAIAILVGCVIYMNSRNGVILDGVTVAGVDVGGMTISEAEDAVSEATEDTFGEEDMVVTVLDTTVTIPAKAVKDFDVKGAVKAAYDFGNRGSRSKKKADKKVAATTGYAVDLTPYLKVDKDLILEKLDEIGDVYNSTLKESAWEVIGDPPTIDQIQGGENLQVLVIRLGVPEYGLDMDELYRIVMAAYSNNEFTAEGECKELDPKAIDLEAILEEYYVEPENASFKSGGKEIIPGVYGYGFDVEQAKKQLNSAVPGTTIEIPFIRIEPEITTDNIAEKLTKDQLSTWTADQESDANRATNLRLACEAIDGIVLYPNEVFSYNQALGERTEERGYKPGESYSNGQTVYTIGGGICQVSSALYYCVLNADLEIVYRDNHGYAQEYVPLGMDAMVSWGSTDFLFRNNRDNPIRITAKADGGKVVISIYGIDDLDYTIRMEYEILSETPSTTEKVQMPADNPEGLKDGDYIIKPYNGYEIQTYRCKYDKQTDELISREKEAYSYYKQRPGKVCEIVESE